MLQKLATKSLTGGTLYHKNLYTYIPPSCYDIGSKPNLTFAVTLGTKRDNFCTLQFRLFDGVVPKTAENFKQLLLGNASFQGRNLSLLGTGIKRYVPRAFFEMGHMPNGNCSMYGPTFRDESFELLHDRPGLLSSISNENTNSSAFLITLGPCSFLDYKNVVFGEIAPESMKMLRQVEKLGDEVRQLQISAVEQILDAHH